MQRRLGCNGLCLNMMVWYDADHTQMFQFSQKLHFCQGLVAPVVNHALQRVYMHPHSQQGCAGFHMRVWEPRLVFNFLIMIQGYHVFAMQSIQTPLLLVTAATYQGH